MNQNDIEALAGRLRALEAKDSIREVIARLARAQDRMDVEAIASCYHVDGFDDHLTFKGSGREFALWFVSACSAFEETMHFVGAPLIEVDSGVAQVNTQCIAHHLVRAPKELPDSFGPVYRYDWVMGLRYLDRFEERNGKWRIAHRKCVFDWMYHNPIVGTIRQIPGEEIVWGRQDRSDASYISVPTSPLADQH